MRYRKYKHAIKNTGISGNVEQDSLNAHVANYLRLYVDHQLSVNEDKEYDQDGFNVTLEKTRSRVIDGEVVSMYMGGVYYNGDIKYSYEYRAGEELLYVWKGRLRVNEVCIDAKTIANGEWEHKDSRDEEAKEGMTEVELKDYNHY